MNDDLRQRITAIFERIEGGSTEDMYSLIDHAIDDGEITKEEHDDNEMAICDLFDTYWFYCTQCGWTQPVDRLGEDVDGEMACDECSPVES